MARTIKLKTEGLKVIRTVDPRLASYNVEMTEVTGGTFWKAYTPEEIMGNGKFPIVGIAKKDSLMQEYPPIDLTNPRLRALAKEIGPAWIRVSGTWATSTYYDFDGTTGGKAPEGFKSVLTKEQWIGVLEFVKAVNGKLLVSVANCAGIHSADEPWNPSQAKILFDFSRDYGVPIEAAEFMNEPNLLAGSGAPKGYTPENFVRDQDIFNKWIHDNYPECKTVGPCSFNGKMCKLNIEKFPIKQLMSKISTDAFLKDAKEPIDVFSYHYYNGVSERIAAGLHFVHWKDHLITSEEYLDGAPYCAKSAAKVRDKYMPGTQMWVTESGDAGGGGNTWGSTYVDVLRTLNELGSFATVTDGIIFHNTLASSDYGFLHHGSFEPRPNYFAVLLWNKLMGTSVYDCANPDTEGAHLYCHSRKDGNEGFAYLLVNNSLTKSTTVVLPKDGELYELSGADGLRCSVMSLNGSPLTLVGDTEISPLEPKAVKAGEVIVPPASCAFIVI